MIVTLTDDIVIVTRTRTATTPTSYSSTRFAAQIIQRNTFLQQCDRIYYVIVLWVPHKPPLTLVMDAFVLLSLCRRLKCHGLTLCNTVSGIDLPVIQGGITPMRIDEIPGESHYSVLTK